MGARKLGCPAGGADHCLLYLRSTLRILLHSRGRSCRGCRTSQRGCDSHGIMHAIVALWGLDNLTLAEVAIFDYPGILRYEEE